MIDLHKNYKDLDGKTVKGTDLLVPGIGELCGGSEREEDINVIKKIMQEKKPKRRRLLVVFEIKRIWFS